MDEEYTAEQLIEFQEKGRGTAESLIIGEATAPRLVDRLGCPHGYHMVFFKEKDSFLELIMDIKKVLDYKGIDYQWFPESFRLKVEGGGLVTALWIRDEGSRPYRRICGVQMTTAIVLDTTDQNWLDIRYMFARLRSPSKFSSQIWFNSSYRYGN